MIHSLDMLTMTFRSEQSRRRHWVMIGPMFVATECFGKSMVYCMFQFEIPMTLGNTLGVEIASRKDLDNTLFILLAKGLVFVPLRG